MTTTRMLLSFGAVVVMTASCRGWNSEEPPVHLNWNMDTQEKSKAYRKYDFFSDGRMMRQPVEGTVARGQLHDDAHLYTGVVESKPAVEFPSSIKADEALASRGKNRYMIHCAPCHGRDGNGDGHVTRHAAKVQPGFLVPPPSLLDARMKEMPHGQVFAAITNGVNNGNMPSYAVQVAVEDRWAISAYLAQIQGYPPPFTKKFLDCKATPDDPLCKPGPQLWKAKGCNACHSLDGTPSVGPTWKGLAGKTEKTDKGDVPVDAAYLEESIRTPNAKVVAGFPPAMPPMPMSDEEVKALVEYIMNDPSLK